MNLANKLTLLRVILVPVFLIFLIGKGIPYGSIIAILLLLLQFNIESIQSLNSSFEASAFLNNFFAYAPKIALFIAVAMTIISGIDYFIKNKGAISTNK